MAYDNTNRGVLFPNKEKSDESHADSSGNLYIGDKKHYLDSWRVKNNGEDTLELQFKAVGSKTKGGGGELKRTDKKGKKDGYPDWKGQIKTAGGDEYWVSAWRRESPKVEGPFLSISIEPKESKPSQSSAPVEDEGEDEAPF